LAWGIKEVRDGVSESEKRGEGPGYTIYRKKILFRISAYPKARSFRVMRNGRG
jgi:putative component of toxin-antitoxin plasmid stabilization module